VGQHDNPLRDWQVDRSTIRSIGRDLQRPECVLAEPDGTLWSADTRGVVRILPDGTQRLITPRHDAQAGVESPSSGPSGGPSSSIVLGGSLPNGLAFDRAGNLLIANFGSDAIELMTREGELRTLYSQMDGEPLGKTNFVLRDSKDRIWFTVTTRLVPWTRSINERRPDGYVGMIDANGIQVVAEGFVGTNEIRFDAREEWLYVVESNARRISRLRLLADGRLTDREIFGPSQLDGVPDGFAFDVYGNLWVTLVGADRLIALTPEGDVLTLLDDGDAAKTRRFDDAFFARQMTPEILTSTHGKLAPMMASITFGGADLRTVYLGSLKGTTLPYFRSPVAGLPLAHWKG
jgi:sugar lactone lactonase YvrE